MDWLEYENKNIAKGFLNICGVDEAGRGPLAGPVCAAAVILPENTVIEGVNDSKKLSEKKREALFDVIKEQALAYSIAFASVEEIEEMNILNAAMLAMKRAVEGLEPRADYAMIDGNRMPPLSIEGECIVKGDAKSMSIACGSRRLSIRINVEINVFRFERYEVIIVENSLRFDLEVRA